MAKKKIKVIPEAEKDIKKVAFYYEDAQENLGSDFLKETSRVIGRIKDSPEQFPIVYKNVRRALVKKFPYMVLYVIQPLESIVLGVFHQKTNPEKWEKRADKNNT